MNNARLLEICDLLIDAEAQVNLQSTMQQLVADMQNVVNNPTHPPSQTQFSARFVELRAAWEKLRNSFSPQQETLIREIGGAPYFMDDIPSEIEAAAGVAEYDQSDQMTGRCRRVLNFYHAGLVVASCDWQCSRGAKSVPTGSHIRQRRDRLHRHPDLVEQNAF